MCLKEVDIVKRTYSEALAIDASKKQVGNFYEKFPSIEAVLDEKNVAFLSMCAAKKNVYCFVKTINSSRTCIQRF